MESIERKESIFSIVKTGLLTNHKRKRKAVLLKCNNCGHEILAAEYSLRNERQTCVCTKSKKVTECLIKRNTTHNKSHTDEYKIYHGMKKRCYNKKCKHFKSYGGRGIKICDKWLESFENFLSDMGLRPSKLHSIERKNVNGDYSKENCLWATNKAQANNKRSNTIHEVDGEMLTSKQVSEKFKINYSTLRSKLNKNKMKIGDILNEHKSRKN